MKHRLLTRPVKAARLVEPAGGGVVGLGRDLRPPSARGAEAGESCLDERAADAGAARLLVDCK